MFTNPVSFSSAELLAPSLIVAAYWVLVLAWFGLYRFDPLQARSVITAASFKGTAAGILVLFMLTFNPGDPLPSSRVILASYGAAIFLVVSGNRVGLLTILRALRCRGIGVLRTLLVGHATRARSILRHLGQYPELGLRVQGLLVPAAELPGTFENPPCWGTLSRLRAVLRSRTVSAVVFALEDSDERQLGRLIRIVGAFRVRMFVAAEHYAALVGRVRPRRVAGHPLLEVRAELLSPTERIMKRLTDLVLASILLAVTLPLWGVIALAIVCDSRGPVLYRQQRVGLKGRVFTLYKFRSMCHDAERDTGAVLAVKGDPRITRVGRIIRRLRLDELPQLWNVLRGEMSLVGPRPERIEFVERFRREIPLYERRLNVPPGITGWSQVHLKYDSRADQVETKLQYDFFYIENMSLPLDLKILFMTLFVVLRGEGL